MLLSSSSLSSSDMKTISSEEVSFRNCKAFSRGVLYDGVILLQDNPRGRPSSRKVRPFHYQNEFDSSTNHSPKERGKKIWKILYLIKMHKLLSGVSLGDIQDLEIDSSSSYKDQRRRKSTSSHGKSENNNGASFHQKNNSCWNMETRLNSLNDRVDKVAERTRQILNR